MSWGDLGCCEKCGKRECEGWCDPRDRRGAFLLAGSLAVWGTCLYFWTFPVIILTICAIIVIGAAY